LGNSLIAILLPSREIRFHFGKNVLKTSVLRS